jgi:hypothetical protein
MALQGMTFAEKIASHRDLIRALLIAGVLIALFMALALIFGVDPGPSYDIVPDPAGALGF